MSILCSDHNLNQLETLNSQLERHCCALKLLAEGTPSRQTDTWHDLLYERIDYLEQTCFDLRTFESALKRGIDLL